LCHMTCDGSSSSSRKSGCDTKTGDCVPKCSDLSPEEIAKGVQCKMSEKLFRKSGCDTKTGECVPKCSDLSPEEIAKGVQCKMGEDLAEHNLPAQKNMDIPKGPCCRAKTAECLACTSGTSVLEYCKHNPSTRGCTEPTTFIHDIFDNISIEDIPEKPCCRAGTPECLACASGTSVWKYCKRNPSTECTRILEICKGKPCGVACRYPITGPRPGVCDGKGFCRSTAQVGSCSARGSVKGRELAIDDADKARQIDLNLNIDIDGVKQKSVHIPIQRQFSPGEIEG